VTRDKCIDISDCLSSVQTRTNVLRVVTNISSVYLKFGMMRIERKC